VVKKEQEECLTTTTTTIAFPNLKTLNELRPILPRISLLLLLELHFSTEIAYRIAEFVFLFHSESGEGR
jgi:hypothetical protein